MSFVHVILKDTIEQSMIITIILMIIDLHTFLDMT